MLHANELTELPDGVFEGLSNLNSLWLQENPGSPFTLTVEQEQMGANSFVVGVAEGAPSAIAVTLTAEGGTLSSTDAAIGRGRVVRDEIEVMSWTQGTVTVSVASAVLARQSSYRGIRVGAGEPLVLEKPAAANNAATGAPTISGTAQVGQTLTADTSGIADADGLSKVSYSYQWLSSRDTVIEGATSSTFTLQASHKDKVIKVRVTFTDDAGNEESVTSDGTSAVVLGGL